MSRITKSIRNKASGSDLFIPSWVKLFLIGVIFLSSLFLLYKFISPEKLNLVDKSTLMTVNNPIPSNSALITESDKNELKILSMGFAKKYIGDLNDFKIVGMSKLGEIYIINFRSNNIDTQLKFSKVSGTFTILGN